MVIYLNSRTTLKRAYDAIVERYEGNVRYHKYRPAKAKKGYKKACCVRISVKDMNGAGSRKTATGGNCRYASWHVIRDYLMIVFEREPNALVTTKLERYNGLNGFRAKYPETFFTPMTQPGVVYGNLSNI